MRIDLKQGCSFYNETNFDINEFKDTEVEPINGHNCGELKLFNSLHKERSDCIPRINKAGFVEACDDTNPIRIEYCPFCGVKIYED